MTVLIPDVMQGSSHSVLPRRRLVRHGDDGRRRRKVSVHEREWLAERFEAHRAHLRAVAFRMLGSAGEADDAVQEAWLKVSRSDTGGVENLGGWLTTVVARVCLDMLRSRRARGEQPLGPADAETAAVPGGGTPETEVAFADAIGPPLRVVPDMLAP